MKPFSKLSQRQQCMLRYMSTYMMQHGYPPTIREMGEECGIASTSVVNYNLNKLVQAGYLQRSGKVSRGLRVIGAVPGFPAMPRLAHAVSAPRVALIGRIAAGEPIALPDDIAHSLDEDDFISVPGDFLGGYDESEVFALRVSGDSMIDSMIQDGDVIILRGQNTAENGDMVAAWLSDVNETTLKHFYLEESAIRLQPANEAYEPIFANPAHCEIKGKVLSVMRNYS